MDNIDINSILERNNIVDKITNLLNNFEDNIYNNKNKKGIYIYGDNGIGKTKFILNLLTNLNYDIIYYDNSIIRNKIMIDNINSNNLNSKNIISLFTNKSKKKIVVIDDIDGMNYGDKNGIVALIKLIRVKKTKKQQLENNSNIPIICINDKSNDKKLLELIKVCNVFELNPPTDFQLLTIINKVVPKLFRYTNNENEIIKNNILEFLNNNLNPINKIIFYEQNNLIYNKFYKKNNLLYNKLNNGCIKTITKNLLENHYNFNNINNILESDRTIISLLFHENIIKLFNNNNNNNNNNDNNDNNDISKYLEILDNYIFCDNIDRIIFQKQIWQLTEINYIIKIFYNNYLLKKYSLFKNLNYNDIIFTKILTKYSSEYNNFIFIYNLLQALLIDKKDIFTIFTNNNINNYIYEFENYNISNLDISRVSKLIDNILNYNIKNSLKDNSDDLNDIDYI